MRILSANRIRPGNASSFPPVDNRSGDIHTLSLSDYALVPGTPLGGEHTPAEIRKIAAGLS